MVNINTFNDKNTNINENIKLSYNGLGMLTVYKKTRFILFNSLQQS